VPEGLRAEATDAQAAAALEQALQRDGEALGAFLGAMPRTCRTKRVSGFACLLSDWPPEFSGVSDKPRP